MAFTPPTDPEDSYELSPFGFGPFPLPGESVDVAPPHPFGGGYGGVGFMSQGEETDGGSPYGLGSYGSSWFARPPINVTGGYGGDPYGFGAYGAIEHDPPVVSSAISINGFEVEVFFSEELDLSNPNLTDPDSYTITAIVGAPVEVLEVHIEKLGSVNVEVGDTVAGVLSVIVRHTGTTQGGTYEIMVTGLTDISGNPILDTQVSFLAEGEPPQFVASIPAPDTGNEVLITFDRDMLPAAQEPGSGPGIEDVASYVFDPPSIYPIVLTPLTVTHATPTTVLLTVQGMTSLTYDLTIGPAFAFSFDPVGGLNQATQTQIGTGTATTVGTNLVMSRTKNNAFGFEWQDTSGSIIPLVSTMRADVTFDFSTTAFSPSLSMLVMPEVAEIVVQDGVSGNGVLVRVTLQKSISGADQIRVRSGVFDDVFDFDWIDIPHTISVVRNMKAGIFTILLDEHPITSTSVANFDGVPETQAGIRWTLLSGAFDVTGSRLSRVGISSSTTVFSGAWNFLHDSIGSFMGSSVLTQDSLLTLRGPLVKGWGDATPATEEDVSVLVNGVAVEVEAVNPYIGKITTTVPIPLLPLGDPQADVKVDYKWFATPKMELAGLNTDGLVLNKDDCKVGHHDPPAHGEQNQVLPGDDFLTEPGVPKGAPDLHRFPMSVVLGPYDRVKPLYIGHRYMGFERDYSAVTNSPTTLLLNQAPGRVSVPGFERDVEGVSVSYEGLVRPQEASPAWVLEGTEFGGVDHDAETGLDKGTFTVIDAEDGPFDPADPQAVVYRRGADLSFPSAVSINARFQVHEGDLFDGDPPAGSSATTTSPDGVFLGVGFGIHDNHRLYMAGALRVNGVEHVGLILDPMRPHETGSWSIGPRAIFAATSQTTGNFATADLPIGFKVGSRFQVITGTQAGVYTATLIVHDCIRSSIVTFEPELPVPFDLFGNKYPEVFFETRVTAKPFSYRLEIDTDQQVGELRVSGETGGLVATFDGNVPLLPSPTSTSLLLSTALSGQSFWGSISRAAASKATWSFYRHGVVPDQVFLRGHSIAVDTEMDILPEVSEPPWFFTEQFGYSEIMSGDDVMLLKNTSEHPDISFIYGYGRTEPFFTPDSIFDYRAQFRMDSGTLGAGDVQLRLNDTAREVRLVSLLYMEGFAGEATYRQLINIPAVSTPGFTLPETVNWSKSSGSTLAVEVQGAHLVTTQTVASRGGYEKDLDLTGLVFLDEGRIFEARLAVTAFTANAGDDTGIRFGCQMPSAGVGFAFVQAELRGGATPGVRLRGAVGAAIQEYDFDWTDGEMHTFRVQANVVGDAVSLVIDDVVQAPVVAHTLFTGAVVDNQAFFGAFGTDITGVADATITSTVEWHSFNCTGQAPETALRTLGVWLGGDEDDINSYEMPRTDSSTAPNSFETGPIIEEMDWRVDTEVRVYRDPGWGVTVFRPDLPLPPFFQPEDGTAGTGFITESTEPSAGWINVEQENIPKAQAFLGFAHFGALDSRSVSQQRWSFVRYRLFRHPTEDRIAPQHMVLNYQNVITSGELTRDRVMETVIVQTLDNTRVTLLPTHLYADSIFKIIDGDTIFTNEMWIFEPLSQTITLQQDLLTGEVREFSGDHVPVTIMFIPGHPVTNTYLTSQPLLDSITLLNEGTPPVPKSQIGGSIAEVVPGLGRDTRVFKDDPDALYEALEFFEITDDGQTGLIASICEGTLPTGFSGLATDEGEDIYSPSGTGADLGGVGASAGLKATEDKVGQAVGAHVFDFKGTQFTDENKVPKQPDWTQKGGMPGGILFASGGNFVGPAVDANGNIIAHNVPLGGTIGPGSAVLYPTFPAKGPRGGDHGRIYQRTDWHMHMRSVICTPAGSTGAGECALEEDFGALFSLADSTAPSQPSNYRVNPGGVTHPLGVAFGVLSGTGDYSHYGPWGGLASLTPAKDCGQFVFEPVSSVGTVVDVWLETGAVLVSFTSALVPVGITEFASSPTPHIALADAINAHPVANTLVRAAAGLTLSGKFMTIVESLLPTDVGTHFVAIRTSNVAKIRVVKTLPIDGDGFGMLTGGAKITQGSLLAGGAQTLDAQGEHDPKLGMVALGGSPLPTGGKVELIFVST